MATDGQPGEYQRWDALAVTLLLLYVAGLVLFCAAALTAPPPGAPANPTNALLAAFRDPGGWWPVVVLIVTGLCAFTAYYLPRRHETRSFSLPITGGLGLSAIVLGVAGVWNCSAPESPFFAPLGMALGMLLGSDPEFVGQCAGTGAYNLALQVARLFGPLLLVITALGIVAAIFRTQLDRLVIKFSRSLVVLVGLSDDAVPLLRRLFDGLPKRTRLAVLVENADHPLTKMARNIGARVAVCDVKKTSAIRTLVLRRNRFKVRALYVVSADVSVNLEWAQQFRDIADHSSTGSSDFLPRITVRIDDPWQAEYWRRTNAYRTPMDRRVGGAVRWVTDALSIYEVTASILVADLESKQHDRLAVVGNSPLALAICAELAQRQREGTLLGAKPRPSFAELVLVGPDANNLCDQHQIRQERFGNSAESGAIAVELVEPAEPALARLLEDCQNPAAIFADDLVGTRKDDLSATLLAAQHPNWTIYHSDATAQGLAPKPIMEQLYPFGMTIEPRKEAALDSWERAARVAHQRFLKNLDHLDPQRPTHRAWEELSPFYQASNVRLVTATLADAEIEGRSWGPVAPAETTRMTSSIEPEQLESLARLEHASWLKFYSDHGWSHGPRNDAKNVHDALVPWAQLPPDYTKRAIDNVKDALSILYALGYRSSGRATRPWIEVSRRGEVTATVLSEDRRWQTDGGQWLQARAGDYQVSDGRGRTWSVKPKIFLESYTQVEGDRWRRTGRVYAQPAVAGELIISLEGAAIAVEGDWVIKGNAGEQWINSSEHFAENYEQVDDSMTTG